MRSGKTRGRRKVFNDHHGSQIVWQSGFLPHAEPSIWQLQGVRVVDLGTGTGSHFLGKISYIFLL